MGFRAFRLIITVALGLLAVWLAVTGALELANVEVLRPAGQEQPGTVTSVLRVAAGVLVGLLLWFSLWGESRLHKTLENIFSIPELVQKLAFTIGLLAIYRIGFHVPLPGVDQQRLATMMAQWGETLGDAMTYLTMFSGGNLEQATLFGLGIMPYITASIILQLLRTVVPSLERLQKEGQAGQKKIQEYTRYLTVALCIVQASVYMSVMSGGGQQALFYPEVRGSILVFVTGVVGLTAGTVFLMWLGEQIDEYGIGNGISLLIMAGIVSRLPGAVVELSGMVVPDIAAVGDRGQIGPLGLLFLAGAFVFVVAGAILITQGQRRIPIQQAKHTRGRRVYGGQRHYMPLRVNHGGVMPIIFASSLLLLPGILFGWLSGRFPTVGVLAWLSQALAMGAYANTVLYIVMIFFFSYFWTSVQFQPREMADQLRDYGHFIPGLRPGRRTAEYLERVMSRITYVGAAFLAVIAVIPTVISAALGVPHSISAFLGGTGLLITVSVTLDLVQRIEANLVMRNYGGFLGGSTKIKGAYR